MPEKNKKVKKFLIKKIYHLSNNLTVEFENSLKNKTIGKADLFIQCI